jgi:ubiquinone/menaquinone biosynthesis C-methylase UbiE
LEIFLSVKDQSSQAGFVGVFNRAAAIYDSHGPRPFAQLGQRLVEVSGVTLGAKVLDVAAGRGAVLFAAADQVGPDGRAVGIDLAENMVLETRADIERTGRRNVEVLQMSADQLEFPDASFDWVLCGFALWFFPQPQKTPLEFLRLLKPGGCMALSTWAKESPYLEWVRREVVDSLPPQTPPPTHGVANPSFDAPEKIDAALRQAGFTDIKIHREERDFVYASDEDWWSSLWSHGIRGRFEQLTPSDLEKFKSDMLRKMQDLKQPDGVHTLSQALFARAVKPFE